MRKKIGGSVELLLVEDNPGDIFLIQQALSNSPIKNRLTVAQDGEEALKMLSPGDAAHPSSLPDLILLDLNLPKRSGTEVLAAIRADSRLCRIPVLILTSSMSEKDINAAYENGANSYLSKPGNLDQIEEMVRMIESYWLQLVVLPPNCRPSAA